MSTLLLLMALAFGRQPPPPASPPPPTMTPEMAQALAGPAAAIGSGNLQQAGDQLFAMLADPAQAPIHGAAWAMLAGLYEREGLLIPAVTSWSRALELAPQQNAAKALHAATLAETIGDDSDLAPVLGGNLGLATDPASRNRLAQVAGRYHLRLGNYGPALGALMMGNKDADGFAEVELLRGIVLAQQERYADAVPPLLTAQNAKSEDARFNESASLNVARAYYGAEDFGQAILWYARVPRSSDYWLDAQFERAWAHFRAKDMTGVLGLLMNHGASFFDDFLFPEQDLLRAYAMFMLCKFPEASKEMDAFVKKYTDVRADLDRASSLSPAEAFADVLAYRAGSDTPKIPAYVLRQYRAEDRMAEAELLMQRVDDELARVDRLPGVAGAEAKKMIELKRDQRTAAEGQRVLERVVAARAQLDGMLEGVEITRLDLLALETQMYERAAATGALDVGGRKAKREVQTRKGFQEWPWQGEYWADELGWYVVNTPPECPDSMQTGEAP
jgi:tetratricopeptide (TPR) repeat protein